MDGRSADSKGANPNTPTTLSKPGPKPPATEETDREAQAHTAIVFLAPLEKYFAALGPDSLAPLSKLHCKNDHLKKNQGAPLLLWSSGRVLAW